MWDQIGPTVKNDSHSVTYGRIRQTVSPPLDSPKILTRDALKIVFSWRRVRWHSFGVYKATRMPAT